MKLVYRATENDFSFKDYHDVCDNLENTLTIIKTEHNKLIGGFTSIKPKGGRNDQKNKTFLLSIDLK